MPINSVVQSFSLDSLSRIGVGINQGYSTVNELARSVPFLTFDSHYNAFQILYNSCVEYTLNAMAKDGALGKGIYTEMKMNTARNFQYLTIRAQDCSLTLSSTNGSQKSLPRPSIFRQKQSFENQMSLFCSEEMSDHVSYGIITHKKMGKNGSASPLISIGIPGSAYKNWLAFEKLDRILESYRIQPVLMLEDPYLEDLKEHITRKVTEEVISSINWS